MLRTGGPKKWIFEEYLNLSEMQFRFKDKETALLLVSSVVHSMQLYPMEEVLTAPYLISEWRPDLIQNLMDDLVPEKCRIVVVGQKVEPICDEVEEWYGTKYRSESIVGDVIKVRDRRKNGDQVTNTQACRVTPILIIVFFIFFLGLAKLRNK